MVSRERDVQGFRGRGGRRRRREVRGGVGGWLRTGVGRAGGGDEVGD